MTSSNKYLNSVGCEINSEVDILSLPSLFFFPNFLKPNSFLEFLDQVLFRSILFDALMNMQDPFQSTEQMGIDCVSGEFSDKMGKDRDSKEFCSQHPELKHGDTREHCDEDMGEYGESCDVLDEEIWDWKL